MKNEKLFSLIIISLLIIIICFFTGCFNNTNNNEMDKVSYNFEIVIIPKYSNETILFLPIPITTDGDILKITNNLKIVKGSGNIEIYNTSYGPILNISCSEKVLISYSGNKLDDIFINNEFPKIILSTIIDSDNDGGKYDEEGDVEFWTYLNSENINQSANVNLHFNLSYSHIKNNHRNDNDVWWELKSELKIGWQVVDGYRLWKKE